MSRGERLNFVAAAAESDHGAKVVREKKEFPLITMCIPFFSKMGFKCKFGHKSLLN